MPHYLKKGPGFCNICLHIDKKFTSRIRITCHPNPHFHDQRVVVHVCKRSYIDVYPRILNKDGEIHGTPWFAVTESPSKKIPTYEASTYQKGSSLIDAHLFRPDLFLQSFTICALLLSENKEKISFTVLKTPPAAFFSCDSFGQLLSQ